MRRRKGCAGTVAGFICVGAVVAQNSAPIRMDVDLVTVACTVTDRNGALVMKLGKDDFVLTDNGKPQVVKQVWQDIDLPLTIGLIVDVSGSQMGLVNKHKHTMADFLTHVMGERDQAFLITVASEVKLVTDVTGSVEELRRGVDAIDSGQSAGEQLGEPCRTRRFSLGCGGTALWNGVWAASRLKMKSIAGRKALVIVSDGMDTGSKHHLTDAIEAAQGADTLVYAIKYVSPVVLAMSPSAYLIAKARHGMRRLAEETGGQEFGSPHGGPEEIFAQIERELRSQYVVAFSPTDNGRDGKFHKLSVKVKAKDMRVRARSGYYAAEAGVVR